MDINKVYDLLASIEWVNDAGGDLGESVRACPYCGYTDEDGHHDACELRKVMTELEMEP